MSDEAPNELSLEEQVRLIKLYQGNGIPHPLTCGVDAMRHPDLVPQIEGDKVILVCTQVGCSFKQTNVPPLAVNKAWIEAQVELRKKVYPDPT